MPLSTKLSLIPKDATSLAARLELEQATRELAQATQRLAAIRTAKKPARSLAATYFRRAQDELKASR